LSILTKILAVLLSVFSLLLAGMFVVFVGNADNYKKMYEDQKLLSTTLQADLTTKDEQYNIQVKKCATLEQQLQRELQSLEADKNQYASDLRKAERLAQKSQADADSWKGVMTGFEQSVRNLQASLSQTQAQLDLARSNGIKDQKELNQITADLYEKIVQLQSLEAERRRLLEQKKELESRVAAGGSSAKEVIPVTLQQNRTASPATTAPAGTDVKGLVVEVQQNLITLSVGSADGVKENMVFHITRAESFLCDVIITNVDINQCAGILDLVQQAPQVGDTASTQL
jgi:cell shape-determining protein MreC